MTAEDTPARVRRYRRRAEELRTMAKDWHDPDTRAKVISMAEDYDRMADHLEKSADPEGSGS
jgi:hypothetical protein